MRQTAFLLLLLLFVFTGRGSEPVTITGELVDLHCYTTRGAQGETHAGCANACISRGVPAGLVAEDGTLYLLLDEKPFSVKDKVAGKAGKKVTARGTVVERGGMKALQITSIE